MAHEIQPGLCGKGRFFWIALGTALFLCLPAIPQIRAEEPNKIQLDANEIAWLKEHSVVRLGFDPAWPPFSSHVRDKWEGIDFDLLALLRDRLGIRFEPVQTESWKETERKIAAGEVDVMTGMGRTPEREKRFLFTSPYVTTTLAVITRNDAPFFTSLHNLRNVIVASPRGYVTTDKLRQDFPEMQIMLTETVADSLRRVSHGKADVAVENIAAASYLIKANKLSNLKIAGIADYHFDLCLAVRKDWPELRSILQKGLNSMSEEERRQLVDQWTAVEYFPRRDWSLVWKIGGALLAVGAVILGLFGMWNRRLARELEERRKTEAALQKANDRLQTMNRDKDRFTGMVAHDLNNPLSAIIMKCAAFEIEEDYSQASASDLLTVVRNNLQRMNSLIKNLLHADRMENGRMNLRLRPLDLSSLASEAVEVLQPCAKCKNIRLSFSGETSAKVEVDRDATMQVMENLISNAIKFTPAGKTVTVRTLISDRVVRVEVEDEGPGVSDEDRPKLFQKYVTLSARPTGNEASNGLGLSIARYLVEAMKGSLRYEGKPGKGALFVVEFPVMARVAATA